MKLSNGDKQVVKEFLDLKSLNQSNLKLVKGGTLIQVEILSPAPLNCFDRATPMFDSKCTDLLGQMRNDQLKLSHKLVTVLDEIKFLQDLVIGPKTRTAPSADVSGEPSLHELTDAATKQAKMKDNEDNTDGDEGDEIVEA